MIIIPGYDSSLYETFSNINFLSNRFIFSAGVHSLQPFEGRWGAWRNMDKAFGTPAPSCGESTKQSWSAWVWVSCECCRCVVQWASVSSDQPVACDSGERWRLERHVLIRAHDKHSGQSDCHLRFWVDCFSGSRFSQKSRCLITDGSVGWMLLRLSSVPY